MSRGPPRRCSSGAGCAGRFRGGRSDAAQRRGILLEDLTWKEAETVLTPDAVVVIPVGAQAKEHGPHLKLRNDCTIAEYLERRVVERSEVVVAPTLNYHFYPGVRRLPGLDDACGSRRRAT